MYKFFLTIFILLLPTAVIASGDRGLSLDAISLKNLQEVQPLSLSKDLNYLGSTGHWHILGEKLSEVSEGRPYDSSFGYKVNASVLTIINGWKINLSEMQYYWQNVAQCPVILFIKDHQMTQITIPKNTEQNCVTYLKALNKDN